MNLFLSPKQQTPNTFCYLNKYILKIKTNTFSNLRTRECYQLLYLKNFPYEPLFGAKIADAPSQLLSALRSKCHLLCANPKLSSSSSKFQICTFPHKFDPKYSDLFSVHSVGGNAVHSEFFIYLKSQIPPPPLLTIYYL